MFNSNKPRDIETIGFSLIEVMVSIMIIGTTFVGLLSAFPFALKIVKSSENRTRASYYAQERIEELYQLGYDAIGVDTIDVKSALSGPAPRPSFQRATIVKYLDENMNESINDIGMKKITCRIYFPNAFRKNEIYYETSTIIADR